MLTAVVNKAIGIINFVKYSLFFLSPIMVSFLNIMLVWKPSTDRSIRNPFMMTYFTNLGEFICFWCACVSVCVRFQRVPEGGIFRFLFVRATLNVY